MACTLHKRRFVTRESHSEEEKNARDVITRWNYRKYNWKLHVAILMESLLLFFAPVFVRMLVFDYCVNTIIPCDVRLV